MQSTRVAERVANPRTKAKPAASRRKFLIAGALVFVAIAYLVYTAMASTLMYYLTPKELLARGPAAYGEQLRLAGNVRPDSVDAEPKTMTLRFIVLDEKDAGAGIPVLYRGVVPDSFKPDAEVVLEGKLNQQGVFEANSLFAKCPTKYIPGT